MIPAIDASDCHEPPVYGELGTCRGIGSGEPCFGSCVCNNVTVPITNNNTTTNGTIPTTNNNNTTSTTNGTVSSPHHCPHNTTNCVPRLNETCTWYDHCGICEGSHWNGTCVNTPDDCDDLLKKCISFIADCSVTPPLMSTTTSFNFNEWAQSTYLVTTNSTVRHSEDVSSLRGVLQCTNGTRLYLTPSHVDLIPLNPFAWIQFQNATQFVDPFYPNFTVPEVCRNIHMIQNQTVALYQAIASYPIPFAVLYQCATGNTTDQLRNLTMQNIHTASFPQEIEVRFQNVLSQGNFSYKAPCNFNIRTSIQFDARNVTAPPPPPEEDDDDDHGPPPPEVCNSDANIFITEFSTTHYFVHARKRLFKIRDDDFHLEIDLCYPIVPPPTEVENGTSSIDALVFVRHVGNDILSLGVSESTYPSVDPSTGQPLQCQVWKLKNLTPHYFRTIGSTFVTRVYVRVYVAHQFSVDLILDVAVYYKSTYGTVLHAPVLHLPGPVPPPPPIHHHKKKHHHFKYCYYSDAALTLPYTQLYRHGKRVYMYATLVPFTNTSVPCNSQYCPYGNQLQLEILLIDICVYHDHESALQSRRSCDGPGVQRATLIDNQNGIEPLVRAPIYDPHLTYPARSNCTSAFVLDFILADCFIGKPLGIEVIARVKHTDHHTIPFSYDAFTSPAADAALDNPSSVVDSFTSGGGGIPPNSVEHFYTTHPNDLLQPTECEQGSYYDHWREHRCVSTFHWRVTYIWTMFDDWTYLWVFVVFLIIIGFILCLSWGCGCVTFAATEIIPVPTVLPYDQPKQQQQQQQQQTTIIYNQPVEPESKILYRPPTLHNRTNETGYSVVTTGVIYRDGTTDGIIEQKKLK